MKHTETVQGLWLRLGELVESKKTKPIVLTGHDLSIPEIVYISRYGGTTQISDSALHLMNRSVSALNNGIEAGHIIYGVNTGFGGTADVRTKKVAQLQHALIRELHYGMLPPGPRDNKVPRESSEQQSSYDLAVDGNYEAFYLPCSWARAAITIRINSLISGCSAVRPVIVERMQDLLHHRIIPMIPLRGSISASGDLSPLSYICGAIQAKPTIRILSQDSNPRYADAAFDEAGLEPTDIQAKEGLAITNGTAVSAAAAALALHDTHALAIIAQVLTAMTVEALNGTTESFHSFFSENRPHPGQIECARNILGFLTQSRLTKTNTGADKVLRQDRYSIRTAPQWLGPILEDLVLAHQQLTIECNSTTDNPLITPEGEFLHGGNFQAKAVTSAMEKARQATQGIGRMLFSQCTELINPATNRGLPPNLVIDDPSISLIFKGTDLNIASLAAELGFLANPVNHVQTAEMGNQSLNSLALISARYTHTANDVLSQLVAVHLVAVCQALDLRAMQTLFLEAYRPRFEELVDKHYGQIRTPTNPAASVSESNAITVSEQLVAEPAIDRSSLQGGHSIEGLADTLWSQLIVSFDTTASLDASDRFEVIAKSLRACFLDSPSLISDPQLISRLGDFTKDLALSLQEDWCLSRDAYIAHGDAASSLGVAAKAVYQFVRQTLKVPLLSTSTLRTPNPEQLESKQGEAPTVGSYNGTVYRAVRDGSLMRAVVDLL